MEYEDIVECLRQAEEITKPRRYMKYGKFNNHALKVYEAGTSIDAKDPFEPMRRVGCTCCPGVWAHLG